MIQFNKDAFSNGQVASKIWLCEELERLFKSIDYVWIYGGWYAVTAFLLLSRNNIKIQRIHSYDIDPDCQLVADTINENWVIQDWQFKAFTQDCNELEPQPGTPDLIINTSTEHFDSMEWFDRIPQGTVVALQGNNMQHEDHVIHSKNLKQFCSRYPLSRILYQGQKEFEYPDWNFIRFMEIGVK